MTRGLADLEALSRMVLDRDLADLKTLAKAVGKCRSEVEELARARAESAGVVAGHDPGEGLVGLSARDLLWRDWVRREHALRQSELARAMADFEAQRVVASKAFGRADALRQIRDTESVERRHAANRRSRKFADMG
ncbi:hypothetical protein [Maritimibacter sp. HL-12]|uniref:hypothetical protein n=1 Tax=Maritimibacter sp. HL-12 TaxID=1162418 RepID=UPI000A0F1BE2|nr:hypothetical protein [Maritimibacter sp. HL-12]SMH42903.1 hypothetical protein SAMN05661107_1376 [Maritimibacter sp. HL-12]